MKKSLTQQLLDNSLAELRYKITMRKAKQNFGLNQFDLLEFRTPTTIEQANLQTMAMGINRRES